MKTILVPTDFSENATNVLNYAAALAKQIRDKIIIAHIINLPVTPLESGVFLSPNAQLKEDGQRELNIISRELRLENGFRFELETIFQYGYFLGSLAELVQTHVVDLVVMGTRGATKFLNKRVGTNTLEFIKMATCPVLAIPSGAVFSGIKQIAYASDFESEEPIFLQQLFGIAEHLQADVSIVNIITEHQLDILANGQVLQDINQIIPDKNYSVAQILENDVVKELHTYVQDNQVDVLAISVHERSFFEKLFQSSISKQLLYQPRMPLLALPDEPKQAPKPFTKNATFKLIISY